ncbi:TonB-dependent receptor [Gluconacetobacter sacchari]|uniref:TonB-dependent receptor n=1 Tax=Gluconacetobacter sacchari TaxID=92759 RepID=UPI0039B4CF9C
MVSLPQPCTTRRSASGPARRLVAGPSLLLLGAGLLAMSCARAETVARHAAKPAHPAGAVRHEHGATVRGTAESLTVSTRRLARGPAEQVLTRATLDRLVPGASPLQALSMTTPGVSFGSDDPYGVDSLANTTYMRGFSQNQLAFAVDGVPLGDQYFFSGNGLDINQAVIQDNIATVGASQGAGALDVPGAENLGGAIRFTTSDPEDRMGGRISQTFGSNANFRTFGRFDSGVLNASGTRFYVAYARTDNRLWKGYGHQTEQQANMKLLQPVGRHGMLSGFFGWSNDNQDNYLNMSLNMVNRLGKDWTYLTPNYLEAYNAANGIYTPAVQALGNPADEAFATYYDAATIQRNYLSYLRLSEELTSRLTSTTLLYAHVGSGDSEASATIPSPNGASLSQAVIMMNTRRIGGIQSFHYSLGRHTVQGGFWFENESSFMPERLFGQPYPGEGPVRSATGPFVGAYATAWASAFSTNLFQFYLQDEWQIRDDLRLLAGFRSLTQTTHGGASYNNVNYSGTDALPSGSLTASNGFLPHVSLSWHPALNHEVYVDIAENMKTYPYSIWGSNPSGLWGDSDQQAFAQGRRDLRPERTWTYVAGYRYSSDFVSANVDYYHIRYDNRALTVTTGPVYQLVNSYSDVGSETTDGADAALTIRPIRGLSIDNMLSYADTRYQGGTMYGGEYYDLSGKHQVAYPKYMYKAGVGYAFGNVTLNFNVNYMSRRPLSYVNDVHVPSYWLANLGASYDFGAVGVLRNLKASLNIYNLFDTTYIGGMGVAGFPMAGDLPTVFVGAPRQVFGTVSARF